MMKIEAIIPRRFWKNSATGQVASVYGACPNANDLNWQIWSHGMTKPFEDSGPSASWGGNPQRGAAMGRTSKQGVPDSNKFTLQHVALDSGGYDKGGAYWGIGEPLYYYESACGNVSGYLRTYWKPVRNEFVLTDYWKNSDAGVDKKKSQAELLAAYPLNVDYIGYLFCPDKLRRRYRAKMEVLQLYPNATFTR